MARLLFFVLAVISIAIPASAVTWNDVSKLNPGEVKAVVRIKTATDVVDTLLNLAPGDLVTISGTRHSQGGHIVYPGAIVLDMTNFNRIVSISAENRTIVVQGGATWLQVQQAANRHGLAVKVMQSSNIFSIGGSLSANVHGRDPRYGPIIETVRSLKMALPSGEVVTTSRDALPDLFHAAIGGYGLLGVILEAEIELTENLRLTKTTARINVEDYAEAVSNEAEELSLHYGRCSFVPDESFLRECYSTNFYPNGATRVVSEMLPEENIQRNALIFGASRESSLGKLARWKVQKELLDAPGEEVIVERNNAMRPPVRFLEYDSPDDTDILQEYFVPIESFAVFFEQLRGALLANDVNLLSITLRFLKANREGLLSYSGSDMIAVVLYINLELNDPAIAKARDWTRDLVDLALRHGGTYYLTYQRFPMLTQFQQAYPGWERFMAVKCKYDPGEVFTSQSYETYFRAAYRQRMKSDRQSGRLGVCSVQ